MGDEGLTDDQRSALNGAFDLLAKDGSGCIRIVDLRSVLQLVGQNPTHEDMDRYLAHTDDETTLSRYEMCTFVEENIKLKDSEDLKKELNDAFSTFDSIKDRSISRDEFRSVMTSRGTEPLTGEQADTLLENCKVHPDGRLDITELMALFSTG